MKFTDIDEIQKIHDPILRAQKTHDYALCFPSIFIGSETNGHIIIIRACINAICFTDLLLDVVYVKLNIHNNKYCIEVASKGLNNCYLKMIDWTKEINLWEAIGHLAGEIRKDLDPKIECYQSYLNIGHIANGIPLATTSIFGIRIGNNYLYQNYLNGVPQVTIINENHNDYNYVDKSKPSLIISADLPPEIFKGLPFDVDEIKNKLSDIIDSAKVIIAITTHDR